MNKIFNKYIVVSKSKIFSKNFATKLVLPKLNYNYEDLEPVLSKENLELHHSKHHQTYIDNYNKLSEELESALANGEVEKVSKIGPKIKFNGGSHINHSIYWTNLAPIKNGGGKIPDQSSNLRNKIEKQWGSIEKFQDDFTTRTAGIEGSGWGYLVYNQKTQSLEYKEFANQDTFSMIPDIKPILTVDVWEHAFYVTYKNAKAKYLSDIWKVINWQNMEERYNSALKH